MPNEMTISFFEESGEPLSYQVGLGNIIDTNGVFNELILMNDDTSVKIINTNTYNGKESNDVLLGYYSIGSNKLKIDSIVSANYLRNELYLPNDKMRKDLLSVQSNFNIDLDPSYYLLNRKKHMYDNIIGETIIDYHFTYNHKIIGKDIKIDLDNLDYIKNNYINFNIITNNFTLKMNNIKNIYLSIIYNNIELIYSNLLHKNFLVKRKDYLNDILNNRSDINDNDKELIRNNNDLLNISNNNFLYKNFLNIY